MARIAKHNLREKILEAAERRLWHYGIKKTTIDEIAADAGVGKGTVYLYFESKEDICVAIFIGYKLSVLGEQEKIAVDSRLDMFGKLRQFLLFPILSAHRRCMECPEALELIATMKPHLSEHLQPYYEREIVILTRILNDGIALGDIHLEDASAAARSIKLMVMGFMPPFPCVTGMEAIEREIDLIVRLVMNGLSRPEVSIGTDAVRN